MDSYSVKAVLSAVDKGFSSTMEKAERSCSSLASKAKSGLGFGIMAGIGQAAFSKVTSGVSGLFSEMNSSNVAWKTFESNMSMIGKSSSSIAKTKKELQDFAQASIYSASDMASTYSQLAAVGTKNCTKLVKGFGGLASAAENPTQAMKTLSQQATQMAAKPYVQWQDFKLMMDQTPAGIAAVAKQMGKSTSELVADIQDGTVKTEDFFDAISKVGTNKAFTKLATSYKSTSEAMDGLVETLSNKLQPAWQAVDQIGIQAVSGLADAIGSIDVTSLTAKIIDMVNMAKEGLTYLVQIVRDAWNAFANTGAIDDARNALSACADAIAHVITSIGHSGVINTLAQVFGQLAIQVALCVTNIANFISSLDPGVITALTTAVVGLFAAYKGYKVVKSATSAIKDFASNAKTAMSAAKNFYDKLKNGERVLEKAKDSSSGTPIGEDISKSIEKETVKVQNAVEKIKTVFKGISDVIKSVGDSIKTVFEGIGDVVKSFGTAIADAAKGIGTGLATAFKGLGAAIASVPPTTWLALAAAILAVGAAFALVGSQGEGLQMVLEGIATVIQSIQPIIQAVVDGIVSMVQTLPAIFMSIGTAIQSVMIGIASIITSVGSVILAVMNGIASGIAALGSAIGSILSGLGSVIQGVLSGIASMIAAFGSAIGSVISGIGSAISSVISGIGNAINSVLSGVASVIEAVGKAALNAGKGFKQLAQGLQMITSLNLFDLAASMTAVAAGLAAISAAGANMGSIGQGMIQFGTGLMLVGQSASTAVSALTQLPTALTPLSSTLTSLTPILSSTSSAIQEFAMSALTSFASLAGITVGVSAVLAGVTTLNSALMVSVSVITAFSAMAMMASTSIQSIGGASSSASASLMSIASSALAAGTSLSTLGVMAQSAMNQLVNALSRAASQATSKGRAIGQNVCNGVRSGMAQLPSIVNSAIASMMAALSSAQARAYSAGAYIGMGLANGLRSQVGAVQAAAAQLAAAADAAIQAKAKIGSPSKVTYKDGYYIGAGLVNGLKSMQSKVWKAAEELIDIPSPDALSDRMNLNGRISQMLSEEYDYSTKNVYYFNLTTELDGKKLSKQTYKFDEKNAQKDAQLMKRLKGVVG